MKKNKNMDAVTIALKIITDYQAYKENQENVLFGSLDESVQLAHLFFDFMDELKRFLVRTDCELERNKYLESFEILSDMLYDKMEKDVRSNN